MYRMQLLIRASQVSDFGESSMIPYENHDCILLSPL